MWAKIVIILGLASSSVAFSQASSRISDKDVVDAYNYYLGRLLVLRQENLDLTKNGMQWNKLIHRAPGGVNWANPNLDVVYSEAWIGIDKNSCAVIEVPEIRGRYYTIQSLNGWGETTSNINERNFPKHAFGKFAYCLQNSTVTLAPGIQRISVPSEKIRILARIEQGRNAREAIALQKQMKLSMVGRPVIKPTLGIGMFSNRNLPGVEAFNNATEVLNSERDINPGMETVQAKVRAIEAAKASQRAEIDKVIKTKAIPQFYAAAESFGTIKNAWHRPAVIGNYGSDFKMRSVVNFGGIWANNSKEVMYYVMTRDPEGLSLRGSSVYTMTFPKNSLPQSLSRYFWSVTVVDGEQFKVIPNSLKRYNLNNYSGLKNNSDGSLTIVFSKDPPQNMPQSNWMPTPGGRSFQLTMRFYGPGPGVASGKYFPPPLIKQSGPGSLAELY